MIWKVIFAIAIVPNAATMLLLLFTDFVPSTHTIALTACCAFGMASALAWEKL